MYGAMLGDIIGSRFEFDRGGKSKDFKLFTNESIYTDDSVMTVAVAEALLNAGREADEKIVKDNLIKSMKEWGNRIPNAGYGGMFYRWLFEDRTEPYGSFGNGSAMRVSSVGWLYDSLERTREVARWTAEVTHNHPEGIKGAEAVATVIYLARNGFDKAYIRRYVIDNFDYDLSRTCDEIRPGYHHVETCQQTVPEAITAFLEGEHFTDVIRTAVSLGGDCDTLTDIAAAMGEAYYGCPQELRKECEDRIEKEMIEVLGRFERARQEVVAVKADWKTEPMPDQKETFILKRRFTKNELVNLRRGNVPQEMEDKWFFFMKRNRLYAYRSWTGYLIYIIEFNSDGDDHKVTVNRYPEQYSCSSIEEDRKMLNNLLNWWTQDHYDYYNEWLEETVNNLKKAGKIAADEG
jgi:ADP-ribosylglycohydrolase